MISDLSVISVNNDSSATFSFLHDDIKKTRIKPRMKFERSMILNIKGLVFKIIQQNYSFKRIPILDNKAAKPIIAKAQTRDPRTTIIGI